MGGENFNEVCFTWEEWDGKIGFAKNFIPKTILVSGDGENNLDCMIGKYIRNIKAYATEPLQLMTDNETGEFKLGRAKKSLPTYNGRKNSTNGKISKTKIKPSGKRSNKRKTN